MLGWSNDFLCNFTLLMIPWLQVTVKSVKQMSSLLGEFFAFRHMTAIVCQMLKKVMTNAQASLTSIDILMWLTVMINDDQKRTIKLSNRRDGLSSRETD